MGKSREEITHSLLHALHQIAPEAELEEIPPNAPLREELEIDSMDFLRLMVLIHEELGVDIPEDDYPKMTTLESIIDYLLLCDDRQP